jgi:hypothetical protein
MRRIDLEKELEVINQELTRREQERAKSQQARSVEAPHEPPVLENVASAVNDFADFPEMDAIEDPALPKSRRFGFFNLKNIVLALALVSFGGYFLGQMSSEEPTLETVASEAPTPQVLGDAFAPQSSARLAPPVQNVVSSALVKPIAQVPALIVEAPIAPAVKSASKPKPKPSPVPAPKTSPVPKPTLKVVSAEAPVLSHKVKAKPQTAPKKIAVRKAVEAPAAPLTTAQAVGGDDALERLRQARELN